VEPLTVRKETGPGSVPFWLVLGAVVAGASTVVGLPVAVRRDEVPVVAGVVATVVVLLVAYSAVRTAIWLRRYAWWELRIDRDSLTLTTRRGTRSYTWPELIDVAFTDKVVWPGAGMSLAIESSRYCDPNPGFRTRCVREFTGRLPHATILPLAGCPRGTYEAIRQALEAYTDGRLPGRYRKGPRTTPV
jgi:hypothetical protein